MGVRDCVHRQGRRSSAASSKTDDTSTQNLGEIHSLPLIQILVKEAARLTNACCGRKEDGLLHLGRSDRCFHRFSHHGFWYDDADSAAVDLGGNGEPEISFGCHHSIHRAVFGFGSFYNADESARQPGDSSGVFGGFGGILADWQ